MANCKECIHWEKCLKNGKTRYYGETIASDNVEILCEWFVPKSEFAEVKHGYWFDTYKGGSKKGCSVCHCQADLSKQGKEYCSHCGAIMDGKPQSLKRERKIWRMKKFEEMTDQELIDFVT